MLNPKTKINFVFTFLVIGHLISALYYLSFSAFVKDSNVDLFSLWFFGSEFLFIALICTVNRTEKDTYIWNIFLGHLYLKGIIYILHYSGLIITNSRMRLNFLLGYVFLLSLSYVMEPIKNKIWGWFNK